MKKTINRWQFASNYDLRIFKKNIFLVSALMILALLLIQGSSYMFSYIYLYLFYAYYSGMSEMDGEFLNAEQDILNAYNDLISISAGIFTFVIICFFLRLILKRSGGYEKRKFKLKLPEKPLSYLVLAIGGFYLFYYISEFIYTGVSQIFGIERIEPPDFGFPSTTIGIILHIISVAVIPAVFEELTFRHFLLNILKRYGNVFAIIVSSVFFGFLHASYNAFFYATAFGVVAAYTAIKTKSTFMPMIMHFVVNFMNVVFSYVDSRFGEFTADAVYISYISLIFLSSAIILIVLNKKNKKLALTEDRNIVQITKRIKVAWFFNIAAVAFIAIAIYYSLAEFALI